MVKVKSSQSQSLTGFCSMKQLRVLPLPPGWDASSMQGYHSSMTLVPIYTLVWRETMRGKVSRQRKQHDGRDWALNLRPLDLKSNLLTTTPRRIVSFNFFSTVEPPIRKDHPK